MQGGRAGRLRCAPLITMMETSGIATIGPVDVQRDRSVIWRVLLEAEVRSTPMIVLAVCREDAPEMRLVHDDHVIETLSPDRADQAFDVRSCHGLAGAETTSAMPMPSSRRWKTSP